MRDKFLVTHQAVGSSTVNDITDCIQIADREGIRSEVDSFSFQTKNPIKGISSGAVNTINMNDGDNIKIYFATDNNAFSIVMDGFVKEVGLKFNVDRQTWKVAGQNRLEVLLNAPIPAVYAFNGTNNNSALVIKNLVSKALSLYKNSKYRPIITAELTSLGGDIDDTTNTLPTFDAPGYYRAHTPVFQLIEELSSTKYTNTATNYIYYIDSDNSLHWEPKSTTVSGTIRVGDFLDANIEKTLFDVINFVIIDAGFDFNGRPIKQYVYNNTGAIKGIKGRYFTMHEIAENMKDPLGYSSDFPFGNKAKDGGTDNSTFRNQVRSEARRIGNQIVGTFGQARYKANILMKGTTAYVKGSYYTIEIPQAFRDINDIVSDSLQLRLQNISQTFNRQSWLTQLEFQQDERSVYGSAF